MTNLLEAAETTTNPPPHATVPEQEFSFFGGLLGFPQCQRYRLERFRPADGTETPFLVLRCLDEDLSFPVIHPASLGIDYHLPGNLEVMTALGAGSLNELMILLIVTVRSRVEDTTVNLQGPLVINPATAMGLQLIVEQYPLRHPMLVQIEY
jgi:flagellar assembly factor FliW